MSEINFSGPLLKVERARQHINQLKIILERYVSDNAETFSAENQNRMFNIGVEIRSVPLDKHTSTVLGDAIHNMRSALDHAYCIMVEDNGHTVTEHTRFPFTKCWESMKGSIKGHIKTGNGPSQATVERIGTEIQPFPEGRLRLYDLHNLDIADKHTTILPVVTSTTYTNSKVINELGVVTANFKETSLKSGSGNHIWISPGSRIVHEGNVTPPIDIQFGSGQPFEGEGMLKTLEIIITNVIKALQILKAVDKSI